MATGRRGRKGTLGPLCLWPPSAKPWSYVANIQTAGPRLSNSSRSVTPEGHLDLITPPQELPLRHPWSPDSDRLNRKASSALTPFKHDPDDAVMW